MCGRRSNEGSLGTSKSTCAGLRTLSAPHVSPALLTCSYRQYIRLEGLKSDLDSSPMQVDGEEEVDEEEEDGYPPTFNMQTEVVHLEVSPMALQRLALVIETC